MFLLKYSLYLRNDNRDAAEKLCVVLWEQKVRKRSFAYLEHFCPTDGTNPCGCRPTIFHCDLFLVFH